MTEASQKEQTRFRNSCDFCTRSKLKCDQEKPSCNRCAMRHQHCVYSRARKVGRPPRASRADDELSQTQPCSKRVRLCSPVPTSESPREEPRPTCVDLTATRSPEIRSPPLTADDDTVTEGTDHVDQVKSGGEPFLQDTTVPQETELLDSLGLDLDHHLENICFDTFGGFHMPTPSSSLENLTYNVAESASSHISGCSVSKTTLPITAQHDGQPSPILELVNTTPSGREQDIGFSIPGCQAIEPQGTKPYQFSNAGSAVVQSLSQISASSVKADFLYQPTKEARCGCSLLLSQVEDSISHQSYFLSHQETDIRLDLMLSLEGSIQRIHESIFDCCVCQTRLPHLIVILCTKIDWLVRNFGKLISLNVSHDETNQQSRANNVLLVGNSRVEDRISRVCVYDLLRHRLYGLGRVLRQVFGRMAEMDSVLSSAKPDSMLKVGRIMTPDILYSLEHLLGMIELHME